MTAKILAAFLLALALAACPRTTEAPKLAPHVVELIDKVKRLPDSPERTDAVWQLAAINPLPPPAIAALADAVKATPQNFAVERAATQGLAGAGGSAIPALTALLGDKNLLIRSAAGSALHTVAQADPQTRPILVEAFNPESGWTGTYQATLASVLAVGPAIVPLLSKALANESPQVRAGAAATLAQMGEIDRTWNHRNTHTIPPTVFAGPADLAPAAPALVKLLDDPDANVREHAAIALAYADSNDSRAVPILVGILQDKDLMLQASAVTALGIMGGAASAALLALEQELKSTNYAAAGRAAQALASIGGAQACPALADAVARNAVTRSAAAKAMVSLGPACPQTIPTLIAALDRGDVVSADALIPLNNAAVPALTTSLQNPDANVREDAVKVLAAMRPVSPEIVAALTLALKDSSIDVRRQAADALVRAGGAQAGFAELARERNLLQQEDEQRARRYSGRQVVASIPADADHKYPLRLAYLFPLSHRNLSTGFLVARYTGKRRAERLVFWKEVGRDQYRQARVIEPGNVDENFESPTVFLPGGQKSGDSVLCVDVPFEVSGIRTDQVFSIDRGELSPVEIGPPQMHIENQLAPDEKVLRPPVNSFTDDHLGYTLSIWRAGDSACCPTGGRVTGTYIFMQGQFGSAIATQARWLGAAGFGSFRPPPVPRHWILVVNSAHRQRAPDAPVVSAP